MEKWLSFVGGWFLIYSMSNVILCVDDAVSNAIECPLPHYKHNKVGNTRKWLLTWKHNNQSWLNGLVQLCSLCVLNYRIFICLYIVRFHQD